MTEDHLSLREIEQLAEARAAAPEAAARDEQIELARQHLAACEHCREVLQMYNNFKQRLGRLKTRGEPHPRADCPLEAKWLELAAGLLPESQADELLEHSTNCDACGLLFRQATEDFADEAAEHEFTELSSLESSQAKWQRALAQRLSAGRTTEATPVSVPGGFSQWIRGLADLFAPKPQGAFRYAWAYAAAAILFVAAGAWLVQRLREPSIDQLIATAYTQQRPFEPRIAGAAFGRVRQERGGSRSALAEPAALARARYLLKEKLSAHPDDATLLAASGRFELLEGNYPEAIRIFGRLLDADRDSPALLTDLATAYFQRAEAGDRAKDYAEAINLLSRALAKNPDDPVALFNRAIALEKIYMYDQAERDWEHYLHVDPNSEWATREAQPRLIELQKKKKAQEKPEALLPDDPGEAAPLLRARANGKLTGPGPWATSLDEEYLDRAVSKWLPSLYVPAGSANGKQWRRNPAVWDALTATADVLRTHHKDLWLTDFLREIPTESAAPHTLEQFVAALDSLSKAAKANVAGDPDSARPLAESAARSFHAAKSNAGYLRAREEIIYSLVRAARVARAQDCIHAASQQLAETDRNSYAWLKGQAILWKATCQGAAGNPGLAQRLSERALELTKSTDYAGQHLRSVLFAAGFLQSTERNWQDTRAGLQEFWAEFHNPFHAYESYVELALLAGDADRWHLAHLLRREALAMIEGTKDRSYQAAAHYRLAVAATSVGRWREAEDEFTTASQKFGALPDSPNSLLQKMASEIDLAAVEIQQGRFDSAGARLGQAKPHLAVISGSWTAFSYYQSLGQLDFRLGKLPEAEQALWSAVHIGEVQLSSLRTDTDRLAWERDAARTYRTLVELYARDRDTTTRALEVWEWYRAAALRGSTSLSWPGEHGLGSSDAAPGPPMLSRVRGTLPTLQHETMVSFALLPSGIAAWAFDDRGVNFAWIAVSEEELSHRVKHFAYLCAEPSSDLTKLRQEGSDLYKLLVAPFEQRLEPSRVLIVEPDSVLSEVPWPALVDPRGKYLGSRFAIVISPGLGYWLRLRTPATISPEQRALVVGMPALAAPLTVRFAPLPDADGEAQDVAARFRHSRLLSGKEVASPAIRQELTRSEVFHFAGHAVSDGKDTGLVLTSPGGSEPEIAEPTLFPASQLEEVGLRQLQLVVLSACATAETEKGFTEPGTLVRGFLRASVPHVVASRWPVDSQTTAGTMTEFYSHLFEGRSAAQALWQAANKLRLQPATSHPYYWAPFSTYGR